MKSQLLRLLVSLVLCIPLAAQVNVKGYTRKDGTYVPPHQRSAPNSTKSDNYSTKGNVNPYTGKPGTKPADASSAPANTTTADAAPKSSATVTAAPVEQTTPATTSSAVAVLPSLSTVTLGMTKAQVVAQVGEPNVKSDKSWFYMNRGWVRFKGDTVTNIEAK